MNRTKRFDPAILFIFPGLLGFVLFFIWPFFISLGYTFVDKPVNGSFVGLRNFMELFRNRAYLLGLKNTAIFMGISIPANIVLSLTVAMLVNGLKKRRELFTLLFLIPLVIPSGSMVFFWTKFFENGGYLNGLLNAAGMDGVDWLGTSAARFVIIAVFIWKNLGYNMVLFLSGLNNIPAEYYEAAHVDGAGGIRAFWHITVRCILPTLVLVIIMSVINSFRVFKEIYLITGSYPHESIYVLQHFMNNMFKSLNYQKLTTATSALVLIVALLTQLLLRFERRVSANG